MGGALSDECLRGALHVPGGRVAEFGFGYGLTEDVILDVWAEDLAG